MSNFRGYVSVQLRSTDNRLLAGLEISRDGRFDIESLPASEYFLTTQSIINADRLATFTLAAGENRSISLPKLTTSVSSNQGFLRVTPFTADGLPLPGCEVTLTGAKGPVPRQTIQSGQVSFMTEPGAYRLSVSYPSFAPVTKQIEVKGTEKNGRWGTDHELNVTLVRQTEPTKLETH